MNTMRTIYINIPLFLFSAVRFIHHIIIAKNLKKKKKEKKIMSGRRDLVMCEIIS